MKFRNKTNGYEETVSAPWLWTLLFGGLYFIAKGLVAPLLIWLILTILFYTSMGAPATLLVIIMNIIMAALSGSIIRAAYLRKGWDEITKTTTVNDNGYASKDRICPFCAETIKAAAIKCKHCGSDLPKSKPPTENGLMARHGITFENGMYRRKGIGYDKLELALKDAEQE